jgi:hypothetical protein
MSKDADTSRMNYLRLADGPQLIRRVEPRVFQRDYYKTGDFEEPDEEAMAALGAAALEVGTAGGSVDLADDGDHTRQRFSTCDCSGDEEDSKRELVTRTLRGADDPNPIGRDEFEELSTHVHNPFRPSLPQSKKEFLKNYGRNGHARGRSEPF